MTRIISVVSIEVNQCCILTEVNGVTSVDVLPKQGPVWMTVKKARLCIHRHLIQAIHQLHYG